VKRGLIHSISISQNQEPAIDFLIKVARTDTDREAKSQALFWLGHKAGEKSLGVLKETVEKEDADTEVQKQAVFVISRRPVDEAVPLLIKIAKALQVKVRELIPAPYNDSCKSGPFATELDHDVPVVLRRVGKRRACHLPGFVGLPRTW
jgi:hypothetical protein